MSTKGLGVGLVWGLTLFSCSDVRDLPGDRVLAENFRSKISDFNTLRRMAEEDDHLVRIAQDFTWLATDASWPREMAKWGLTPERWAEYRRLLEIVDCSDGILRRKDQPGTIFFISATRGLAVGGSMKGYAYGSTAGGEVVNNLQGDLDFTHGPFFMPLQDKWFLFVDAGG